MKRRCLTAVLLLLSCAGAVLAQNPACPRPDCPNQGMCQRKGNGNRNCNGTGNGNGRCDGFCLRDQRGQGQGNSGNGQSAQARDGGMRWGGASSSQRGSK